MIQWMIFIQKLEDIDSSGGVFLFGIHTDHIVIPIIRLGYTTRESNTCWFFGVQGSYIVFVEHKLEL